MTEVRKTCESVSTCPDIALKEDLSPSTHYPPPAPSQPGASPVEAPSFAVPEMLGAGRREQM